MQGIFGVYHTGGGGVSALTHPSSGEGQLSDFNFTLDPALLQVQVTKMRLVGRLTGTGSVVFRIYQGGSWTGGDGTVVDGTLLATSPTFTPSTTVPIVWTTAPIDIGTDLTRIKVSYQVQGVSDSLSLGEYHILFYNTPPDTFGIADSSPRSLWSEMHSFRGEKMRAFQLTGGFSAYIGGYIVTDLVPTPTPTADAFLVHVTGVTHLPTSEQFRYQWRQAGITLGIGAEGFAGSLLTKGIFQNQLLLTGGNTDDVTAPVDTVEVFSYDGDTNTATVTERATMATARTYHGQSTTSDGLVLVSGGIGTGGAASVAAEQYDHAADLWLSRTDLQYARYGHAQFTLPGDHIIAIGGFNDTGPLNSCEIYDFDLDEWRLGCPMAFHRANFRAVQLPDGRVVVVGGRGFRAGETGATPAPLQSCEIYDPKTHLWNHLDDLSVAREFPGAEYLPNWDRFYVTGGTDITTTEFFTTDKMVWRNSPANLGMARNQGASVRLQNEFGDFMVYAGGLSESPSDTGPGSPACIAIGSPTSLLVSLIFLPGANADEPSPGGPGYPTEANWCMDDSGLGPSDQVVFQVTWDHAPDHSTVDDSTVLITGDGNPMAIDSIVWLSAATAEITLTAVVSDVFISADDIPISTIVFSVTSGVTDVCDNACTAASWTVHPISCFTE